MRPEKPRAEPKVRQEAVVAVTNPLAWLTVSLALLSYQTAMAAVLPEDRADILYHSYDGGGAEITGPSILVRKNIADKVSVYGNYYVDMVTSASIDVVATASPYTEERTETSIGADYLYDKTVMSLSLSNSSESDYDADTVSFAISQDFFGDLTTLGMGFTLGNNSVRKNGDTSFEEETETRRYRLSISQILSKNMIASLGFESVIDEGYLNNPYRSVRYLDPSSGQGYSYEQELYPATRNSDAIALRTMYHLPYRAALKAEYRKFSDSWGIEADSFELRYTHPYKDRWLFEAKVRFYDQSQADFYSDLFAFQGATTFRARDKELSNFSSQSFGLGASYELRSSWLSWGNKSTVNLYWDFMQFDYGNFRDVTQTGLPGEEPLYQLDANVLRLFFSVWY